MCANRGETFDFHCYEICGSITVPKLYPALVVLQGEKKHTLPIEQIIDRDSR